MTVFMQIHGKLEREEMSIVNDELKKYRAVQCHAFQMYTLLEEMTTRCKDSVFRQAAKRMLAYIKEDADLR